MSVDSISLNSSLNSSRINTPSFDQNGDLKSLISIVNKKDVKSPYYAYVPKWAIGLSAIGMVAISIIAIAAVKIIYLAPRPGFYQESCEGRSCLKGLNLKCINSTCLCATNYYYTNKCIPRKTYMQKCHSSSQCEENTNLICFDGVCKCNQTSYWNNKICSTKSTYSQSCSSDTQCNTELMLKCNTIINKCLCESDRFWDGTACYLKKTFNESCSSDSQCLSSKNLGCTSGQCQCKSSQYWDTSYLTCRDKFNEYLACYSSDQCFTPMNCSTNKTCQCGDKQYHDISTLTCVAQKINGQSCSNSNNCRVDKHLECRSGTCQCVADYPTWSTDRLDCIVLSIYTQSCTYQSDCDSTKSLICNNGTNCTCPTALNTNKCDCVRELNNESYWNGYTCLPALSYGQSCSAFSNSYMCKTLTENTICNGSISFTCSCSSLRYYRLSTSKCENQLLVNQSCPQGNECRLDLGLTCQSGNCSCSITQYWNGSRCVDYYTYNNETCSNSNQCKGTLVCRTSSRSCTCPIQVSSNKCDCPRVSGSEYFWNGTDCELAGTFGDPCTIGKNYTCQTVGLSTYCNSSGTCDCDLTKCILVNGQCKCCVTAGQWIGWLLKNQTCYGIDDDDAHYSQVCQLSGITSDMKAILSDNDVKAFFRSIADNSELYWVNAQKTGSDFVSSDNTWTLNSNWCPSQPESSKNFAYYNVTLDCYGSLESNQEKKAFCQYDLI